MHLKFDSRTYARFFVMGLAGAITLFLIVLLTFQVVPELADARLARAPERLAAPRRHLAPPTWSPSAAIGRRRRGATVGGGRRCSRSGWPCSGSGPTGRSTTWPSATSTRPHGAAPAVHARAPPPLIAGIPAWMWRDLLRPRGSCVAFRFLTRPVVALIVFNGLLLFTHWPEVVDGVGGVRAHSTSGCTSCCSAPAIVMWWPVMSPLVELPAAHAAGADDVPVRAVARADDPGVVPHLRAHAPVPGVRDVPPDLGHLGARRPADRRAPHEDRRRAHPVGRSSR